jgi:hypothetical protein
VLSATEETTTTTTETTTIITKEVTAIEVISWEDRVDTAIKEPSQEVIIQVVVTTKDHNDQQQSNSDKLSVSSKTFWITKMTVLDSEVGEASCP